MDIQIGALLPVRACLVAQSCPALGDPMDCCRQAPLSMGFPRQGYWRWSPCPSPGDLPNPRIEPRSHTLQVDFLLSESPGKPVAARIKEHYCGFSVCLFVLKTNDRKARKVSFSLVTCPNGNSKQALYSLNKKFFNVKKIPYLRKNIWKTNFLADRGHWAEIVLKMDLWEKSNVPWGIKILILFYWILL